MVTGWPRRADSDAATDRRSCVVGGEDGHRSTAAGHRGRRGGARPGPGRRWRPGPAASRRGRLGRPSSRRGRLGGRDRGRARRSRPGRGRRSRRGRCRRHTGLVGRSPGSCRAVRSRRPSRSASRRWPPRSRRSSSPPTPSGCSDRRRRRSCPCPTCSRPARPPSSRRRGPRSWPGRARPPSRCSRRTVHGPALCSKVSVASSVVGPGLGDRRRVGVPGQVRDGHRLAEAGGSEAATVGAAALWAASIVVAWSNGAGAVVATGAGSAVATGAGAAVSTGAGSAVATGPGASRRGRCRSHAGLVGTLAREVAGRRVVADPVRLRPVGGHAAADARGLRPDDLGVVTADVTAAVRVPGVGGLLGRPALERPGGARRGIATALPVDVLAERPAVRVVREGVGREEVVGPGLGDRRRVRVPGQVRDGHRLAEAGRLRCGDGLAQPVVGGEHDPLLGRRDLSGSDPGDHADKRQNQRSHHGRSRCRTIHALPPPRVQAGPGPPQVHHNSASSIALLRWQTSGQTVHVRGQCGSVRIGPFTFSRGGASELQEEKSAHGPARSRPRRAAVHDARRAQASRPQPSGGGRHHPGVCRPGAAGAVRRQRDRDALRGGP